MASKVAMFRVIVIAAWVITLILFGIAVDDLPYGNGRQFEIIASLIAFPFGLWCISRFRNGFALALLLIGCALYVTHPDRAFSSEAWKDVTHCDGLTAQQCNAKLNECRRLSMVRDLIAQYFNVGETTRDSLRTLLGVPDEWSERFPGSDIYYMGYCGYLGIHNHLLEVEYTPEGKLERYAGKDYNW
jgi:hypothetical protein